MAQARGLALESVWQLAELQGRVAEVSGWGASAVLTAAVRLVLQAQHQGEPAVWISLPGRGLFPPDAAANGIDLAALPVVRAPDRLGVAKAADLLVRSGAFGLLVLDVGRERLTDRQLSRLSGLARKHQALIVCLTHKPPQAQALSSLVSWRGEARRTPAGFCLSVLKDKRRGPGASCQEGCRGPAGLR